MRKKILLKIKKNNEVIYRTANFLLQGVNH